MNEQVLQETGHIDFSEEQCITFIEELIYKLKIVFNKKFKLVEEE